MVGEIGLFKSTVSIISKLYYKDDYYERKDEL